MPYFAHFSETLRSLFNYIKLQSNSPAAMPIYVHRTPALRTWAIIFTCGKTAQVNGD